MIDMTSLHSKVKVRNVVEKWVWPKYYIRLFVYTRMRGTTQALNLIAHWLDFF